MKNEEFPILNKIFNNIHIEILEHGRFYGERDWNHRNITSPFNRLYFIMDGEGCLENSGGKVALKPGRMYLIPAHSTNSYLCTGHIEKFYVHFHTELFFGKDIFEHADSCLSAPFEAPRLAMALKQLEAGDLAGVFSLKALLYEVLGLFLLQLSWNPDSQLELLYKYRNVYRIIRERRSWRLTPGDIAEQVRIPLPTLMKDFKKDTGASLKSCINSMTLQWAREKILLTDMSFKEIAFSLDFADEFYFSRFFKRHTGVSPKDYRKKNKLQIYS